MVGGATAGCTADQTHYAPKAAITSTMTQGTVPMLARPNREVWVSASSGGHLSHHSTLGASTVEHRFGLSIPTVTPSICGTSPDIISSSSSNRQRIVHQGYSYASWPGNRQLDLDALRFMLPSQGQQQNLVGHKLEMFSVVPRSSVISLRALLWLLYVELSSSEGLSLSRATPFQNRRLPSFFTSSAEGENTFDQISAFRYSY